MALIGCSACASADSTGPSGSTNDAGLDDASADAQSGARDAGSSDGSVQTPVPDSSVTAPPDSGGTRDAESDDAAPTLDAGGTDSTTAQGCAGLPLCDGFESDTVGSPPNAALWQLVSVTGCSGQSAFSVTVDSSQANSGSNSVKIVGGDSCGPLMINSTAVAALSSGEVYGRFFVRFSTAMAWEHTVFGALSFEPDAGPLGNNTKEYLQIAALTDGTTPIMEWNYDDTELPQRSGMELAANVYPAASAWTCIEFHTSKSQGSVEVWINDMPDSNMTFIPGTTTVTGLNSPWSTAKPTLDVKGVGFGWVDFHSGSNTLWFDDIAISGSRIGCQAL